MFSFLKLSLRRLRARPPVVLGPLFFHELHRTTRRGRHTFLRLLYTSIILTFLYLTYSEWTVRAPLQPRRFAAFGVACFTTYALVQLGAVFLLAPAFFATTVTDEKEGRTLEFLLTTDLRSREIVLSKLLARLAHLALLILAGLPILAILELSGGVAPEMVAALFAATAVSLVSLAGVSAYFSVRARKSVNALLLTYLTVAVYLAVSGALMFLLQFPSLAGTALSWGEEPLTVRGLILGLNAGNLPVALLRLNDAWRSRTAGELLLELLRNYAVFHGLVTAMSLGGAIWRLRAAVQREAEGVPGRRRSPPLRPAVWGQPVLWKELFVDSDLRLPRLARAGIITFFVLALAPAMVILGQVFDRGLTQFQLSPDLHGIGTGTFTGRFHQWPEVRERMNLWISVVATVEICALLLIMLLRAAGSFSSERACHTLDSLLTTPLSSASIVAGKALGCLLPLRAGAWSLGFVLLAGYATRSLEVRLLGPLLAATLVYAGFFILLGLYLSSFCRTTTRATLAALCIALGSALAPGVPLALLQLWYLKDELAFRDMQSTFDLLYLFSPPEMVRFLLQQASTGLWARFTPRALALAGAVHLLIYLVATGWLWRSLCRRLRVEMKPQEVVTITVPALRAIAAEESLA